VIKILWFVLKQIVAGLIMSVLSIVYLALNDIGFCNVP
jgi:hypothetical protein